MPKSPNSSVRFWRFHWLGRALQLAAASASSGAWIGAINGFYNWYDLRGNTLDPWWHWTGMTAFYNAIWMGIFGLCVGVPLFLGVAALGARWSARRRWRFARDLNRYLLLPLVLSLILTSDIATLFWLIGLIPRAADLGDILVRTEMVTLAASGLLFGWLLGVLTRRPRKRAFRVTSRLLPIR